MGTISPEDLELIKRYEEDRRLSDLSPKTIEVQGAYIRKFAMDVGLHYGECNAVDLIRHRQLAREWFMRPTIRAAATKGTYMSAIGGIFVFGNKEGFFKRIVAMNGALEDYNPIAGLKRPKTHRGEPNPIPEDELERALALAPDAMMKAWLILEAMCGLRCKEVAFLEASCLRESDGIIHLTRTKGEKPRDVPLYPEVLAALREYGIPEEGRFWNQSPEQVSRKVNDFLHKTVGTSKTAHKLRHRFGTVFYEATGNDSFLVADVMGHSSTEVTRTYAKTNHSKAMTVGSLMRIGAQSEQPAS